MGVAKLNLECRRKKDEVIGLCKIFDADIEMIFLADGIKGPYNSEALKDILGLKDPSESMIGLYRFIFNPNLQMDFEKRKLEKYLNRDYKKWSQPKEVSHRYKLNKLEREKSVLKEFEMDPDVKIENLGNIGNVYAMKGRKYLKNKILLEKGDMLEVEGEIISYGKGFSEEKAKASAYFELIERLNSMLLTDERKFFEYSVDELKKGHEDFVDPAEFLNCMVVPRKNEKLEWVETEEMISKKKVLLPAGAVYYLLFPKENLFNPFSGNSIGLAASNEKEYAIKHALYEIIEKDAAISAKNLLKLNNESFPNDIKEVIKELHKYGLNTTIELSTEIPYFVKAFLEGSRMGLRSRYEGMRFHPDPEEAVKGAFSEAVMAYLSEPMQFTERLEIKNYGYDFNKLKKFEDSLDHTLTFFEKTGFSVYLYSLKEKPYLVRVISPDLVY
jgi:hypothetical protein